MNEPRPHYFHVGGLTIQVEADLAIPPGAFDELFEGFRVHAPGPDTVCLRHHFSLPELPWRELGRPVCVQPPWAVYRWGERWVYAGLSAGSQSARSQQLAVYNDKHSQGDIYHMDTAAFQAGHLSELSQVPGDEDLLARLLALRDGCLMQAAGLVLEGQGLALVCHTDCGCSDLLEQMGSDGVLLCDERVILRRWPTGYRVHGSWLHGARPQVSSASYPLRAVLVLEQTARVGLTRLKRDKAAQLLPMFAVKPLLVRESWLPTLDLLADLARQVPVYRLRFDQGGGVRYLLRDLVAGKTRA